MASDIIDFPTRLRVAEPPHPVSNTGAHDFPPLADVDVTGGLDGCRLWVRGRVVFEGTATAVYRLRAAALEFERYGLLHLIVSPQEAVRAMMVASLFTDDGGDAA